MKLNNKKVCIFDFENRIADKVLCISEEVRDTIKPYLKHEMELYRNPAIDSFINNRDYKEFKSILIVSNHCPEEYIRYVLTSQDLA